VSPGPLRSARGPGCVWPFGGYGHDKATRKARCAAQGYEGTSVGEIESAAGLVPRSGALYKHFPSKRALLGGALAARMDAIDRIDASIDLLPDGDPAAELAAIASLALDELERQRDLARVVMKDGDRFPDIAADFHDALAARGRQLGVTWLSARAIELGIELDDPEATAEVLVDALVARALKSFMFGERLTAVERERFIAAWTDLACRLLEIDPRRSEDE
jgi:AcrR family transcriptional regulator